MNKVFAFLGNERKDLSISRHNAGFIAAEEMRKAHRFPEFERREDGIGYENYEYSEGEINGEKVVLVKPIAIDPTDKPLKDNGEENPSYGFGDINHSGFGLRGFLKDRATKNGEKIGNENITIFVDALSKEAFPKSRYVTKSSCEDETHNGVKSIGNEIGGGFVLVEIPVGKQKPGENVAAFVSGDFQNDLAQERELGKRAELTELDKKKLHSQVMARCSGALLAGHFSNFNNILERDIKTVEGALKDTLDKQTALITKEESTIAKLQSAIDQSLDESEVEKQRGYLQTSLDRVKDYSRFLSHGKDAFVSNSSLLSKTLQDAENARVKAASKAKKKPVKQIIDAAILSGDEILLIKALQENLQGKKPAEMAEILTRALISTFKTSSPDNRGAFSMTKIIIEKIKSLELSETILTSQKNLESEEMAILHQAVNKNISPEQLEIILDNGFGVLVDKEIAGKTPLKKSLESENRKQGLPIFWQIYPHCSDVSNIDDCFEYAKANEESFKLTKEGMSSDLEIAKMLPHRLLKEQKNSLEFRGENSGKKPKIFTPYYDYAWGRSPKQVLQDFGCEIATPDYDIADDRLFSSPEELAILKERIATQVASSNGLTVLGNFGNIDPKFFTEGETVDLKDFYQRRTFVEMVALQEAIKQEVPIWTICGGTQMAITALGGKIARLDVPQDLRGNETADLMKVKEGSLLHLATHSKDTNRGDELLDATQTWSAHYQGAALERAKEVALTKTEKFSVFDLQDSSDEFAFTGLPENIKVVAVSEANPHIPKAYQLEVAGKNLALMIQSHLEADPSTNAVARNAINGFVKECRKDLEEKIKREGSGETPVADPKIMAEANKIGDLLDRKVALEVQKRSLPRPSSQSFAPETQDFFPPRPPSPSLMSNQTTRLVLQESKKQEKELY